MPCFEKWEGIHNLKIVVYTTQFKYMCVCMYIGDLHICVNTHFLDAFAGLYKKGQSVLSSVYSIRNARKMLVYLMKMSAA